MKSQEYKQILRVIIKNVLHKNYPALKFKDLDQVAIRASVLIHARMYGANVDGVESPLWRQEEPPVEAKDLIAMQQVVNKMFADGGS